MLCIKTLFCKVTACTANYRNRPYASCSRPKLTWVTAKNHTEYLVQLLCELTKKPPKNIKHLQGRKKVCWYVNVFSSPLTLSISIWSLAFWKRFHKTYAQFVVWDSSLNICKFYSKGLFRVKMHSLLLRPGSDNSISLWCKLRHTIDLSNYRTLFLFWDNCFVWLKFLFFIFFWSLHKTFL